MNRPRVSSGFLLFTLPLCAFLLTASATPSSRTPAAVPPAAPGSFAARVEAVVKAQDKLLLSLEKDFAAARDAAQAQQVRRKIDLVKRSAELRLFEIQLERIPSPEGAKAAPQLQARIDRLRETILERSARYGIPVPSLDVPAQNREAGSDRP